MLYTLKKLLQKNSSKILGGEGPGVLFDKPVFAYHTSYYASSSAVLIALNIITYAAILNQYHL